MFLLSTIFRFEYLQLRRQPPLLLLLLFYIVMGIYSLYTGHAIIGRQLSGLDSLRQTQATHLAEAHQRFHGDTSTLRGKQLMAQAGVPQVVEFRHPPYTMNPPHRLAVLAVGQRDLLPYFDLVNSKRDVLTPPGAEFVNAEKLAAGNFDLAYVIVYLFPLLIIVWSHNCLSQEKENQVDKLLTIQGASLTRIICYKLLFRFLVLMLLASGLSIPGFIIYRSGSRMTAGDAGLWLYLVFIYLLFWFTLCGLIIRFNRSSRWNMLCALGAWLLFMMVLPALTNSYTTLRAPVPLLSSLASSQRECKEETWELPVQVLLDSFYLHHPEYTRTITDTAEYGNRRFIAYADLLGRRTDRLLISYQQQQSQHRQLQEKLLWLNPVTQAQHLLYTNAASGLDSYTSYQLQVTRFQHTWVAFINSHLLYDKNMQEKDLDHLPVFHFRDAPGKTQQLLFRSISIWLAILLILGITIILPDNN